MEIGLFDVGMVAVAVLVLGWLVVSFSPAGARRSLVEWISTTAMYVALVTLFVHLCLGAWEKGSTVPLVAFGFLAVVFSGGCLVSLSNTLSALRGKADGPTASAVS